MCQIFEDKLNAAFQTLLAKHIPKIQPLSLFQGKNKISTRYEWLNLFLKVSCIFLMVLVFIGYFLALSRDSNLDTNPEKIEIKCASNSSIFGKFSFPLYKQIDLIQNCIILISSYHFFQKIILKIYDFSNNGYFSKSFYSHIQTA